MLVEVGEDLVASLADLGALVGVPGAGLLDDAELLGGIDELAELVDADAVEDLEVGLAERWRELVLDDLDLALAADCLVAALDRLLAPDIEAHGAVELEGIAAGGGLGVAVDDTDLLAKLVDEDDHRLGPRDLRGELAQRLAHEARLQAHVRIAHLALDLGARGQCGDRIDDDQVDRAGADQC